MGNWSSIVGTATRLWTGRPGVQIPVGVRDSSLLRNIQTGSGVHPDSYSVVTVGLSWGCKVDGL